MVENSIQQTSSGCLYEDLEHLLGDEMVVVPARFVKAFRGQVQTAAYLNLMIQTQAMQGSWFVLTSTEIERKTGMGSDTQRGCKRRLTNFGLLEHERKGIPASTHFYVDLQKVIDFVSNESRDDIKKGSR